MSTINSQIKIYPKLIIFKYINIFVIENVKLYRTIYQKI